MAKEKLLNVSLKEIKASHTFSQGFMAPFRAFKTIKKCKGIVKYLIVPFFVDGALLIGLWLLGIKKVYPWLASLIPTGEDFVFQMFHAIIIPFLFLAVALLIGLSYCILGNFVSSFFNESLAYKVEKELFGETAISQKRKGAAKRSWKNSWAFLGWMILINSLMVLGILYTGPFSVLIVFLAFLIDMFFLGSQFLEFPFALIALSYKQRLKICWRYRWLCLGLGLGFFVQSLIPLVNFFSVNTTTIGATELYLRYIKPYFNAKRLVADQEILEKKTVQKAEKRQQKIDKKYQKASEKYGTKKDEKNEQN